ncbi:Putative mycofactocin biosynthesis glycosyltransferase MftF [Acaryochloris thomasi RCC1774]|uniref:Mycofactocin biosynthesis glycosyltransferase MftF n=2 Tax=Acaryochloris TaxID=155977 RepID=A0A2W1JRT0_9CYAN|nr:Putative mycofactocin biosynthesis glycosyltransferase MftF [Acaryochloris thomasi RCC1774]
MPIMLKVKVPQPYVSVIIPVFNDSARLKRCLQVLDGQTYARERYEVIVVDNASEESVVDLLAQFVQAVSAYEGQQGSYAARNRGLSLAKGEIIAFTDSDCVPASDWIESGVTALLQDQDYSIVGGRIELFFRNSDQLTPAELYEDLTAFPQKQHIEKSNFSPTANLFTYRRVFDECGVFNQELKSNGDREWCQSVVRQGCSIRYDEKVVVQHPARHSFLQLYRRHLRMAGGRADAYKEKFSNRRFQLVKNILLNEILPDAFLMIKDFLVIILRRKYSAFEKAQIVLVSSLLRHARSWEKVRVIMGGTSRNF